MPTTSSARSSRRRPTSGASTIRRSTTCSNEAEEESDPAEREELYQEANRKIMAFAAGVPYVHAKVALAFDSDIEGFVPSPVGVGGESFATVATGSGDSGETEVETETTTTEE